MQLSQDVLKNNNIDNTVSSIAGDEVEHIVKWNILRI